MKPIATLLCSILVSAANCFAQHFEMKDNTATKKGFVIGYAERLKKEAHILTYKEPGDKGSITYGDPVAVTFNGQQIYRPGEITESPQPYTGNATIQEYLLNNSIKELGMLPDGTYVLHIDHILIDTTGKVVSYHYLGIRDREMIVTEYQSQIIANRVDYLMNAMPPLSPGYLDGTKVPVLMDILVEGYEIEVKNYLVSYKKIWDNKHIYEY